LFFCLELMAYNFSIRGVVWVFGEKNNGGGGGGGGGEKTIFVAELLSHELLV